MHLHLVYSKITVLLHEQKSLRGHMVSKKYVSDFRLENVEDRKGRVVTKPVYRGDYYGFGEDKEKIAELKKQFALLTSLQVVLYLLALVLNMPSGRIAYVSLPFLAVAFPLLGQADAVYAFCRSGEKMTRMERDKISENLVSWMFVVLCLAVSSAVGHVVYWVQYGETVKDAIFLVITILVLAFSYTLFSKRAQLKMVKVGTAKVEESKKRK